MLRYQTQPDQKTSSVHCGKVFLCVASQMQSLKILKTKLIFGICLLWPFYFLRAMIRFAKSKQKSASITLINPWMNDETVTGKSKKTN